jgi:hypothetical protein
LEDFQYHYTSIKLSPALCIRVIALLRAELPDGLDSGHRKQNVAWPNYPRLILCPFAILPEVGSVDSGLEQKDNPIEFLIQARTTHLRAP